MVIVPEKLTKEMIDATRGFCWIHGSKDANETVQAMWEAMLKAGKQVNLAEKNAVFRLGLRNGKEELQEELQELLGIQKLIDNAMENT
tara:strand:- start:30018 stop:30281 length:264 start_codon:yes stop_codon:yes gene_type:complete